jgi:hypothetical protein
LSRAVSELTLFPHQEIEALAHQKYDTVIHIGGVGSGKTLTAVLWILDRSRWDTAQEHALFTYTAIQREQVLQRIYPWLEKCGVRHVWNSRPPKGWVEKWKREGVPQPPERDRYTNTLTFSTGLRIQTGTLFNKAYEQFKGPEWGSILFEEWTSGPSQEAIEWVMDRARCGEGIEYCAQHHRHTKILHGNPPEDDGHWSFDWLALLEAKAARLPGGLASNAADSYPNLAAGIGSILYIQSSSDDNPHTGAYAQNIRDRVDDETARRRLGGEMRRTRNGLVYSKFTNENEHPVGYDPNRTLYVNLDFNNRPIASGLCHPLNPGEYPTEHQRPGISHVGKFGEVFDSRGGGLQALCSLLLGGDVGNKGAAPSNWRGLLEHRGPIIFFGDGTGLNKSASGQSLWSIVDDVIGRQLKARGIKHSRQTGRNEIVPIRVRSLNAKLCSSSGVRSFWIDPRCERTIADLMGVVWDKTKPDVQKYGERGGKERWLLTHLSDADGYMMLELFPMGMEASRAMPDFGKAFGSSLEPPTMR